MPPRLERPQTTGNFHFITFGCHNRLPLLATPDAKNTFLAPLEQTRLVKGTASAVPYPSRKPNGFSR